MKATIAIPIYNDVQTLQLAVRSVFAQTLEDWELILVDDGSSDGSVDLVRQIDDPRVSVYADGKNQGLAARLNEIADLARADVLLRMDADDAMHPERLSRQLEVLEKNALDLVASRAYAFDIGNNVYGLYNERPIPISSAGWLNNGIITHPSVAGRTEWFRRNRYDEGLRKTQDKELWIRAATSARLIKLDERLLFYRVRGNVKLSAYKLNYRYDRLVVRRYGPGLIGEAATRRLLITSHLKSLLATAAFGTGTVEQFQRRRVSDLSQEELTVAQNQLVSILRADVPGWPSIPVT